MTNREAIAQLPLRQRKHAQTKLALLRATVAQLETRALEQVSVKELCAEAGISEASFFNYFPRKPDLLAYFVRVWALGMEWHARRAAAERGGLAAIEEVLVRTAREVARHSALMAEIVAWQARLGALPAPAELSPAERLLAHPDLEGIAEIPAGDLGTLLPPLIDRAVAGGELPAGVDRGAVLLAVATIFFGVPVVLRLADPALVEPAYRAQLATLWAGLGARRPKEQP